MVLVGTFAVIGCSSSDTMADPPVPTRAGSSPTPIAPSTTRLDAEPESSSTTTSSTTTTTTLVWQAFPSRSIPPLSAPGEPVTRVSRVETTDRVVFLTIDDGFHRDPRIPGFLVEHQMPASVFLVRGPMLEDPEYFRQFLASGSTINSHTLTHPSLSGLPLERQRREICGMVDLIRETYGFSGMLFRPPYGSFDGNTRRAAADCGLAAVVTWNSELWEGNVDLARRPHLQPGDIFLTHFRTDLYDNLVAFAARVKAEGFTVALLDHYLTPPISGE